MNIQQIMNINPAYNLQILIFLTAIPVLTLILNILSSPKNNQSPWKYIYSVLVYLSCIPGIFSGIITLYSLFFIKQNLLTLNITTYYLPIVSMIITLSLIRKVLTFDEIPGYGRLSGLMLVIGLTFVSVIIIERTRIFVMSSIQGFIILCLVIFFVIKYGFKMIFGDFKKRG